MPVGRRLVALATAAAISAAFGALGSAAVRASAAARSGTPRLYPSSQVDLYGHGFGPGIGMGQWGDFGYAEQYHETYAWIVGHFYGHTTAGTIGDPAITVAITENDGAALRITSLSSFKIDGRPFAAHSAARIVPVANGEFEVQSGTSCSTTTWKKVIAAAKNPEAAPANSAPTATKSQVLELCRADGVLEALRGDLRAIRSGGAEHTVNVVPMDEYLAGVVPSEISYAWGTFGAAGPQGERWGFQSLEAQAIASRSYARAYYEADGGWQGYADVCDSADCQAYEGMQNENPLSDKAVTDTTGMIRVISGSNVPATTQFSASTGGYTSGIAFPAVPDAGDAICLKSPDLTCNPSHDWTKSIPVADIEAAFPSIGPLVTLAVTTRNGYGDLGGRVGNIRIEGSKGSINVSGDQFAGDFGLLSDWFAITNSGGSGGGLKGYWLTTSVGQVTGRGGAQQDGSLGKPPPAPIVGMASVPNGTGYWLTDSAGDIYPFGKAARHGSLTGRHLNKPIVGMAATPDGGGYWLVASDGGIFAFGDAKFYGSTGNKRLNKPIVGMSAAAGGSGYWLVASDGGIFNFGRAAFYGSTGSEHLTSPIVGMAPLPTGLGYWLVSAGGAVFPFGQSRSFGSLAGAALSTPAVALLPTLDGQGYDIVIRGGTVFSFGDAPEYGGGASSTVSIAGDP